MRRPQYAIISEMLYLALGDVHKARLINSCKISHKMCDKYIANLLKKGLLEEKDGRFHTTKKGIHFLETYQDLERLLDDSVKLKIVQRTRIRKKRS